MKQPIGLCQSSFAVQFGVHVCSPSVCLQAVSCGFAESNEFILYAVRNSIHRYDLATGTDQALPLAGLREAVALDFDYDRNCLYWADISLDTIQVSGSSRRCGRCVLSHSRRTAWC